MKTMRTSCIGALARKHDRDVPKFDVVWRYGRFAVKVLALNLGIDNWIASMHIKQGNDPRSSSPS